MSEETTDRLTVAFYVGLLAWSAILIHRASTWASWRDQLFPLLVAVPTSILLVVQFVRLRYSDASETESTDEGVRDHRISSEPSDEKLVSLPVVLGWVVLFPVMIRYLGVALSIPLYLAGFVGYLLGDLKRAAKIAVLVTGIVLLLFVYVLEVPL